MVRGHAGHHAVGGMQDGPGPTRVGPRSATRWSFIDPSSPARSRHDVGPGCARRRLGRGPRAGAILIGVIMRAPDAGLGGGNRPGRQQISSTTGPGLEFSTDSWFE
jgi:hypothetical protein